MISPEQTAIASVLLSRINTLLSSHNPSLPEAVDAGLTRPPRRELGDLSTNLAMRYAKKVGLTPEQLACQLVHDLDTLDQVAKCTVVPPGFINITFEGTPQVAVVAAVLQQQAAYGQGTSQNQKILVEYVSSNPTGPLHIGHGRGAAYGATLVNLLRFSGYQVDAEYYVNDFGRQMAILALSVWLRGEPQAQSIHFPDRCYKGDYVHELARHFALPPWQAQEAVSIVTDQLPQDPELAVDECLKRVQAGVGATAFAHMQHTIGAAMVKRIEEQLTRFKVHMDCWFSEASLFTEGKVEQALAQLADEKHTYTKDGAQWFASHRFGDEKDRVIRRANGSYTYFATDIAYHLDKCRRGYDRLINIFGSDHDGYLARLRAALRALGEQDDKLLFIVNQFAVLWQKGEKMSLSTRAGVMVDLDQLFSIIGVDAARFMYLTQRHDQHLEFDLDVVREQSRSNPVYYVNYAYARAGQICLQAEKAGTPYNAEKALAELDALSHQRERDIIDKLGDFPSMVQRAAHTYSPHSITVYVRELAGLFHHYYAAVRVIDPQGPIQARLALCQAVRQVIHNALALLDIVPPEQM